MALFHLHVTQVKRSAGQSAVASAAYRAGEKLYSEYYGEDVPPFFIKEFCQLFLAFGDTIHCPLHLGVRRHLLIAGCDVAVVEILQNFSHFSALLFNCTTYQHIVSIARVGGQSYQKLIISSRSFSLQTVVQSITASDYPIVIDCP